MAAEAAEAACTGAGGRYESDGSCTPESRIPGIPDAPTLAVPPTPTGLDVSCGIGVCLVSWDNPFSAYDNHGQARIYRNTVNQFSTATEVGQATWIMFTDGNLRDNTSYYYWVVFESDDGERGPVSSVASDETGLNPGDLPDVESPEDDEEESDQVVLEGPTTLSFVGTTRQTGTASYSVASIGGRFPGTFTGRRPVYAIDNWGVWAKKGGATVFKVYIEENDSLFATDEYALRVEGRRTGSNPASGSATWTGSVRAYEAHPTTLGRPVTGAARIEANLSAATVDVSFTGFSHGHADMAWNNLRMTNGAFSQRSGYTSISGAFYGSGHEGAAGTFSRDRLDGVFGAVRQ